jgi:hypothetical protein
MSGLDDDGEDCLLYIYNNRRTSAMYSTIGGCSYDKCALFERNTKNSHLKIYDNTA